MKILITGGAGFIGLNIVDELIKLGNTVSIVDNLSTGNEKNINKDAVFYMCNIRNKEMLDLVFKIEKPEVVIHNAAQIDVQTSAAVYGNPNYLPVDEKHPIVPISFYGISKYTPEHYIKTYCKLNNINYTIFRYSNVYGIRQDPKGEGGVVSIFMSKFLNGEPPIIFGDGKQTRDFIYVKDVVKANILVLNKANNEILNISTGVKTSINELFYIMKDIFNSKVKSVHRKSRNGDILHGYLDNKLAMDRLHWKVEFKIKQGLEETIRYYFKINDGYGEVATSKYI
ncbi:NAD-dependent epimerase/dehydratase family protein [Clostridium sporogenes]|uniref:NAD-dependent epimerase/dehydratase family protein n=1 Tax=Clostridium sporogenes TaxID=1509 RepID=UPI00313D60D6